MAKMKQIKKDKNITVNSLARYLNIPISTFNNVYYGRKKVGIRLYCKFREVEHKLYA